MSYNTNNNISGYPTPSLTPSLSAGASPAQSEIRSPDLNPVEPFALGESYSIDNDKVDEGRSGDGHGHEEEAIRMPECWGHRGVRLVWSMIVQPNLPLVFDVQRHDVDPCVEASPIDHCVTHRTASIS